MDDLDEKWITDFEEKDKLYDIFYNDDVHYVKLYCIYIDKLSNIEVVKKDNIFFIQPNYLSREELLGILKKYSTYNDIKYSVMSILKYNIDLDPTDVKFFLNTELSNLPCAYEFLKPIKNIDAISFNKTITMFQDLNDLFIIFYEKDKTHTIMRENMTKKIYISNSHKKTLKKTT